MGQKQQDSVSSQRVFLHSFLILFPKSAWAFRAPFIDWAKVGEAEDGMGRPGLELPASSLPADPGTTVFSRPCSGKPSGFPSPTPPPPPPHYRTKEPGSFLLVQRGFLIGFPLKGK